MLKNFVGRHRPRTICAQCQFRLQHSDPAASVEGFSAGPRGKRDRPERAIQHPPRQPALRIARERSNDFGFMQNQRPVVEDKPLEFVRPKPTIGLSFESVQTVSEVAIWGPWT
jgi:hypothetical protein